jgi:hypothetical protein
LEIFWGNELLEGGEIFHQGYVRKEHVIFRCILNILYFYILDTVGGLVGILFWLIGRPINWVIRLQHSIVYLSPIGRVDFNFKVIQA